MAVMKRSENNISKGVINSVRDAMGIALDTENDNTLLDEEIKMESIFIRISSKEKKIIAKKAKKSGMKIATYVRFVALNSTLGTEEIKQSPFS